MSYYEDFIESYIGEAEDHIEKEYDPEYWCDRHGKKHRIKDMDTGHIINCILMCRRENFRVDMISVLEEELKGR